MKNRFIKIGPMLLMLMLFISACGSGGNNAPKSDASFMEEDASRAVSYSYDEAGYAIPAQGEAEYSADAEKPDSANLYGTNIEGEIQADSLTDQQRQEKKIKDANMSIETNDFDMYIDNVKEISKNSGGYVENFSSHIYNANSRHKDLKSGAIVVRIPSDKYSGVIAQIRDLAKVKSFNESERSETDRYYDIDARMKAKKIQEERLLQMIEKAEKVEDLIVLEQRLSETRESIELYISQMNEIDSKANFSTINIDVLEVAEEVIQPVSGDFVSQVKNSFKKSINLTINFFENVIIFIVGIAVPLTVIAIPMCTIFVFFRIKKKSKWRRHKIDDNKNEGNDLL